MVDLGFVGPSRPANDHEFVKVVDGDTPRVTMDIRAFDLNVLLTEADKAWTDKLGAWHEFGEDLLLACEYRACIKLGVKNLQDPAKAIAEAYQRVCVDLRTMTEVGLYGYHLVPPQHRLWIWASDLEQSRKDLPLVR
ncbi:hypothetical protein [Nonomuraea sp. GTA35]|uniref:hypothetical protein n=1 Tax=Nonomuraea sp. GTA35 TaxID=1676746 RepID=UPI0035C12E8B